jgi:WD40 repeat protein
VSLAHLGLLRRRASLDRTSMRPNPHTSQVTTDELLVHALALSPDGNRLATAANDKTIRVWDAASGQQLLKIPHDSLVQALAFSPDGNRLATGSRDKRARIWMLEEPHE